MKKITFLACFCLVAFGATGQKPEIISVDKTNGPNNRIVTINGNDFGSTPANLRVFFGGAAGQIKSVSNQIIQVFTPAGATFDNISVTNTVSGLASFSPKRFFMNYGGEHGIEAAKFGTQTDFNAESGLYDLCSCDFNNDGKVDLASVGEKANTVSFHFNNSSPGNVSFSKTSMLVNAETLHVTCGDLNGDGFPDVVATENDGNRLFIFKNNGNSTFTRQTTQLSGNKVKRVAISDLDLNGKADLIVTDQLKNVLTILRNQSTLASISFASPFSVTLPGVLSSDAVDIQDLNNDGLPEIVTSTFFTSANNKILILVNKSAPGTLNFDDIHVIDASNTVVNIRIGDLDGDDKPDFATTRILNSDIQIYKNTSTVSTVSFASPISIATNTRPWGLDFGDLDGDSKLDIVVASIEVKELSLLNNQSTPGTLAFSGEIPLATTYINKHIRIGDIDGDGKPDLSFTSIDDGNQAIIASKISVITNKECLVPTLTPGGPLTICDGVQFDLQATESNGTMYLFRNNGSDLAPASTTSTMTIATAGSSTVTATSDGCEKTSVPVVVETAVPGVGLNATPPDARNNGPVCSGDNLQLQVNDVGATSYRWKGPNGFEHSTTSLTITLNDFSLANTGEYIVEMFAGDCISKIDTTIAEIVNIPDFSLGFSGSPNICAGDLKNVSASPLATSGFAFQWFEQTQGAIPGANSSSYAVNASGTYYLQAQSTFPGCPPASTDPVTIAVVQPPEATFIAPAVICLGTPTDLTNQSNTDANATAVFSWNMGDGNTLQGLEPAHTYTSAGIRTITLTVNYSGVTGCTDQATQNVEAVTVVQPDIAATMSSLCPEDSTELSIEGTYASIAWNNSATTSSITVTDPGNYTVQTIDNNNCGAEDEIIIGAYESPVLSVSAPKDVVRFGENIQLTSTIEDPLDDEAVYAWSPAASLDDSTAASPIATPQETTVYVLVATSEDGCIAIDSVTIQVATIGVGIKAAPIFTPNNDGDNDTWAILGVENYSECTLTVFDSKGRRVLERKNYQNDWQADELPDGVYYFVFGCPNETPTTGSVTVVR